MMHTFVQNSYGRPALHQSNIHLKWVTLSNLEQGGQFGVTHAQSEVGVL